MPSRYYDVSVGPDDTFVTAPSATPPPQMPAEADALRARLTHIFDLVRLFVPSGQGRTQYAQHMLAVARTGLQEGDIGAANTALDDFDEASLNVRYYNVHLDDQENLTFESPPRAPNPMPDEVNTFSSRLDKGIAKVKFLVTDPVKRSTYLQTLIGFGYRGLTNGDLKSATSAFDFEAQFVSDEGPAVRKTYIQSTLKTAAKIVLGAVVLGVFCALAIQNVAYLHDLPMSRKIISTALPVVIGMCLGVSFFAFVNNLNLTFDSLGHFDPARLDPWLRFALVGIVTLMLAVFLMAGIIKLEISGVKFDEFWRDRLAATILGILCGYSDVGITRMLTNVLNR